MAGDWLKVETVTPDKAEVHSIAEKLSIDADSVTGKLIRVWAWFDQHTEKGNDASVTTSLIDRVSGVSGFAEAMLLVGWLHRGKHGLELPNFCRHNGQTAKTRALTAKRVATHKKRFGNDSLTPGALPREEKRRDIPPLPPSGAFLRFWTSWPKHQRKQAQGKCWSLWRQKDFDQIAPAVLEHVESLKASEDWQRGYVPAPLVYLNQRRWEGAEAIEPQRKTVAL